MSPVNRLCDRQARGQALAQNVKTLATPFAGIVVTLFVLVVFLPM